MGYILASFIVFIVAQVKIPVTLGADVPFTLPLAMSLVGLFGALSRNIESLQVMYRVTTSRDTRGHGASPTRALSTAIKEIVRKDLVAIQELRILRLCRRVKLAGTVVLAPDWGQILAQLARNKPRQIKALRRCTPPLLMSVPRFG